MASASDHSTIRKLSTKEDSNIVYETLNPLIQLQMFGPVDNSLRPLPSCPEFENHHSLASLLSLVLGHVSKLVLIAPANLCTLPYLVTTDLPRHHSLLSRPGSPKLSPILLSAATVRGDMGIENTCDDADCCINSGCVQEKVEKSGLLPELICSGCCRVSHAVGSRGGRRGSKLVSS